MTPGEPSAINTDITTPAQAWSLIEQDYTLRISLVVHEWATEHLLAWNSVFAEGRRRNNSGYVAPALVEMEIADCDRRAEWIFRTCCDIWDVQGRTKCRPFFRAVFEQLLQPMFSIRESCFLYQLELQKGRTGASISQGLPVAAHMNRRMCSLQVKWNTKLEIASRDNEYQQKRARSQKSQQQSESDALIQDVAVEGTLSSNFALSSGQSTADRVSVKKRPSKSQSVKMAAVFGALQNGLKASKYCAALDGRGLRVPDPWVEDGCPSTYAQAYKDPKWRKRIQDDKCRYGRRYESMSPQEREAIIQGKNGTRRTRR